MARSLPPVPAPIRPVQGMRMRLEPTTGPRFVNVSIGKVNSRSFYASVDGQRTRHLLSEWSNFLRTLCSRGRVVFEFKELQPPAGLEPWDTFSPPNADRSAALERLRRARQVVKTGRIERTADLGECWSFTVHGGRAYQVVADPGWRQPPSCTCPDAEHRNSPWCKHSLAVLLSHDALRCQVLDVLLLGAP